LLKDLDAIDKQEIDEEISKYILSTMLP